MGYYQDQLNKLMAVEASGFNPYTESYSARIGQIQSTPDGGNGDTPVYSDTEITSAFEQAGVDNTVLDDVGFNTLYNRADDLGLDRQRLANTYNKILPPEEQIIINPTDSTLSVKKPEPIKEENVNYGKYYNAQTKKTTRKRENERTGEIYEEYGTSQEEIDRFKEESELYKQSKENAETK